eukprot:Skav220840  [mRNA]  locus=scaffold1888:282965:283348:+ [translate_table: standard]
MNAAFRLLYNRGAWLTSADAAACARHGLLHLRAYKRLAELSLAVREPRFPVHTKFHLLNHIFRFLEVWSKDLAFVESPLTDSCQIDESFIGIISRYSRRVSPKMTVQRALDIYLCSLRKHIEQEQVV